ncbi:MAG: deoxyribodipyrimidine photo-lyase, partial [Candidatus Dormiibacterota bacterium]
MSVAIMLFTRDLRIEDNPALAAASRADRVIPLFVADPALLGGRHGSPNRVRFLQQSLDDLDERLRRLGARLVLRTGDPVLEVGRLVRQHQVTEIHLAADVSAYAMRRLHGLRQAAGEAGCRVQDHPGVTVLEAGAV